MTKTLTAEYNAEQHTLRLSESLDGVVDGQRVEVTVKAETQNPDWWRFCGALSGENGESFVQAIDEAFPIER